jgi:type I restriction enzyme S subunit
MTRGIKQSWVDTTLGDVVIKMCNGTTATQSKTLTNYPVSRIETISNGTIDWNRVGYLREPAPGFELEPGDILYSHINSMPFMGRVARFRGERPLYHGMNLMLVRADERKVDAEYLFRVLESEPARHHANLEAKPSINQASLGKKQISRFRFKMPQGLKEQRRISEVLSTVDSLIETTEVLIAKKEAVRQGFMQDVFDSAKFGGNKAKSNFGPITKISEINPRTPTSLDSDELPFLSMGNVTETGEITQWQYRRRKDVSVGLTNFVEGDVLFAKITPCMENGKGAFVEGIGSQVAFGSTEFHVLRAKPGNNPRYIYQISRFRNYRARAESQMVGSAGQKRVPARFFKEALVYIPDVLEQNRIVEILSAFDGEILAMRKKLEKLRYQKAGLMSDLLSGLVPVDEVAS